LLQVYYTGHCTCCSTILPDIAFAAALFYWALHLLHLPAGPFDRSFGVWETHPIWDNLTAFFDLGYLGYLLPPNQGSASFVPGLAHGCASWLIWGLSIASRSAPG